MLNKRFKVLAFFGFLTVYGKGSRGLMYCGDGRDLVELALSLTDLDKKSNRGASLSVEKGRCDPIGASYFLRIPGTVFVDCCSMGLYRRVVFRAHRQHTNSAFEKEDSAPKVPRATMAAETRKDYNNFE